MIKVLIADDERVECEAVEKMVRGNFPEAVLLPSVYDGTSLVETVRAERPDIAIVDINMPGLNGLDALEILRAGHGGMEIVIHTAYHDFDYIHRALKLGAADYLVKPLFMEDFCEVFRQVLQRCMEKKTQEEEASLGGSRVQAELREAMERNAMMSLLLGKPDEQAWKEVLGRVGDGKAAVLSLAFSPCANREFLYQMFAEGLLRGRKLLSIPSRDALYCVIFGGKTLDLPERLARFALEHEVEYWAGVSEVKEDYHAYIKAVEEADAARQGAKENSVRYSKRVTVRLREDHFGDLTDSVARLLKGGQGGLACQSVEGRLLEAFPEGGACFADGFFAQWMIARVADALKMDWRRTSISWTFPSLLAILSGKGGRSPLWATEETEAMASAERLGELLRWEIGLLQEEQALPIREENPYVGQVMVYIHKHYAEELSLEGLAELIGITKFYLSRLLKQERGQTFLELLTQERLYQVLRQMLDPTRSIQDINLSVGYSSKYFYQIFRNETGYSQKELREALFQ